LLQSDRASTLLIDVLQHYRAAGKYKLHAFVIMPDHIHLLLTVGSEMTVERAVQLFKGGYSYRAARELQITGEVWQRGFSEVRVLSAEQFVAMREYILLNPVRAHLVACSSEYRYSSATATLDGPPQRLKPLRFTGLVSGTTEVVP
jgi:putative transposase